MSEAEMHRAGTKSVTLERTRAEVLRAARPLPPGDEALIDDLTDDEDRLFVEAIVGA